MRTATIPAAITLALLASGSAIAQEDRAGVFDLGVVEVTAARLRADDAEMRPEAVDALDITRHVSRDVTEALERVPGISTQNIGQRSEKLVYLRGFNSRQVPLFIDGIPVYVPYDGNIDLSRFGVDDLSRIIVTKGLTSVLYGPNALGGSINLVSRRPTEPLEASASIGAEFDRTGDNAAQSARARIATRQDAWYAQASVGLVDRDFFRIPDDAPASPAEDGGRRNNSGNRDLDVSAKIGFTPNASDEYVLSYYRLDGEKETPPYAGSASGIQTRYWRWPQYDKESLYAIGRRALGENTTLRVRAYHDTFTNLLRSFDDARYATQTRGYAFDSLYDDFTTGASAELEQRWTPAQLTRISVQTKRDVHREDDRDDTPREIYDDRFHSIAIEHQAVAGAWTFTPGIAYHMQRPQQADNKQDGVITPFDLGNANAVNGGLAVSLRLRDTLDVFGGVSRKTRFATLKDRYSYRFGSALPNPGLDAETSDNLELGIEGRRGALDYRVALFRSELDDAIESVTLAPSACTSPPCFQLQNIGQARNQGVELSGTWTGATGTTVSGHYTYLDRRNLTRPDLRPLDTPRQIASATLEQPIGDHLRALVSLRHESGRFSATDGLRTTSAFNTVDANLDWQIIDSLSLRVGVRNANDTLYAYEEGFFEPGRTWFARLNWRY